MPGKLYRVWPLFALGRVMGLHAVKNWRRANARSQLYSGAGTALLYTKYSSSRTQPRAS